MFDRLRRSLERLLGGEDDAPEAAPFARPMRPVAGLPLLRPRVLMLVFDPPVASEGNQRLSRVLGWHDPTALSRQYANDLEVCSGGLLQHEVVGRQVVDALPAKVDGFQYSPESFLAAWRRRAGFHDPDGTDYERLIAAFDLDGRVARGEIDEVWLFGPPYAGFWESTMAGPGAFWCNSPPVARSASPRRYVIMGFNYERDVGCMLENFGHRTESIMSKVYERHAGERNLWQRFCRYDKSHPGRAECGNVHFAPSSQRDYDWGNPRPVPSRCDTWYRFPNLDGSPRTVGSAEWGGGDMRAHHLWWFDHLPRAIGATDGVSNNWWPYVVSPDLVG